MNGRNTGTVAIVTGGYQGVGRAIVERLIEEGCTKVAIAGRNAEAGSTAARELSTGDVEVIFVRTDTAVVADCHRLVDTAVSHFGRVNALVNAAGTGQRGSILETTEEMWNEVMNTNARGPFFLMQRLSQHLVETGQPGSMVNILSMCVHCCQSYLSHYAASKGALATLTKNAANALRHHRIRCNAILPGWMDTPGEDATQKRFHNAPDDWLEKAEAAQPMGMLVKPHHLASLAAYLLSPESGVMTGALIDFDQNVAGAYPE